MALIAALAAALTGLLSATVIGLPPLAVAAGLIPGVVLVATRPDRRVFRPGFDTRLLVKVLAVAAVLLYLFVTPDSPEGIRRLAQLAFWALVPLSLLWPEPAVLRFCVLLSAACLVGADASISAAVIPILGMCAAAAVALVATHRFATARAERAAAPAPAARRVGQEALVLFAGAALLGLLVASILPPPRNAAGRQPRSGRSPRPAQPGQEPPYLQPTDRLDAGGPGSGTGKTVVFRVTAGRSALWRTLTFDSYDGRTWQRSPELDSGGSGSGSGAADEPPSIFDEDAFYGSGLFTQRVRIETGSVGVLPAAVRVLAVELPGGGYDRGADDAVFPTRPLGKGATYIAGTLFPPSRPDTLRSLDAGALGGIPPDVRRLYLGFPAVPSRVTALAAEITAGAPTAYDKLKALQAWIQANTVVKSGTPPLAPGADPIDQFLFVDRSGSSEQAASAMAVMLRSIGIPSRLAVGYLPGDRSLFGDEFVVRARHAHAWIEAWFPRAGWVPFDPSGRFSGPTAAGDSWLQRLLRLLGRLWWLAPLALAAVAAWIGARALAGRRAKRARPWATRCYERLGRAGERYGRPRAPAETPAEYCAALAAGVPDPRLAGVGELVTVAAYSGREPPAEARAWADEVVAATERGAPRGRGRGVNTSPSPPPG